MAKITAKRLRELLDYEPETGIFRYRISHGKMKKGREAGYLYPVGCVVICLDGARHYAHRLAWFYTYGVWPKELIDHKDRVRNNNRIDNLRECSYRMNCYNAKVHSNSKTGIKGVYFEERFNKYRSRIIVKGKEIFLGHFETKEEARAVYNAALIKYAGEFAGGI